jgi:aspartate aminotransferase
MPTLGQKISQVQSSPTLALNESANKLRQDGAPVINLGIGEPLNDCPDMAVNLANQILETRQVKYGPASGNQKLKEAIQAYTQEHYGRTPGLKNITITNGAKQTIFNLLQILLDPDDEVIIFSPYWVSYPEMIKLANGKMVVVETNDQFIPDMDEVLKAVTPLTKVILINSPNNPTGAVYPPEFVAALVDLCESKGIFLLMDDIYHQLVFDPAQWVPGYVFTSQKLDKSHLVIINGVSKTYGMTGFRVGWAIGPEAVIGAMNRIQSHSTSGVSGILQEAARGALSSGSQQVSDLRTFIRTNRDLLIGELKQLEGLKLAEPGGAFYCFPDFSSIHQDSQELAALLLEKAYVVTVPGAAFGKEGYLRLSFTCSREEISESAKRIRWVLDRNYPKEITIGGKQLQRNWEI